MRFAATTTALLAILSWSHAAPAFEVRVRAAAELELEVTAAGTVAQVAGTLRDDLQRPLPQRELEVRLDARSTGDALVSRTILTDGRGQFSVAEELPPGDYEVFVRFDATDHLDGIAASESLRLDPQSVSVRVFGPSFVYRRDEPAWVAARASAGPTAFQGVAEVRVGDRSVGQIDLDTAGRGTFDVAPHLRPGSNAVTIRTPGSAYRDPAEATLDVRFAEKVRVEAKIEERLERLARGLAVSGVVADEIGPLGDVRVRATMTPLVLFDDDEAPLDDGNTSETAADRTVSVVTDDDGRFVAFVPASRIADGTWSGSASFVPPRGDPVTVDAGQVDVDSRAYRMVANGFGIAALLIGLFAVLGRFGSVVWERYLRWREQREQQRLEEEALEEVEEIVPVFIPPPLGENEAIHSRHDVGGVVWDAWRDQPIAMAELELLRAEERLAVRTDGEGRFRFEDVPDGTWELSLSHFGYMRGRMMLELPHDGRLGHFRLDAVAVPLKIRRLYGTVVAHRVGEDLWGKWSPREIEARIDDALADVPEEPRRELRSRVVERLGAHDGETVAGDHVMAALTEVIEEAYFSDRIYGEEAFRFARELALRLRAEGNA